METLIAEKRSESFAIPILCLTNEFRFTSLNLNKQTTQISKQNSQCRVQNK